MRRFEVEGYVADILGCAITLADLQLTLGRLRDAERTFRDALDLAGRQPGGPLRGTPDMHVGLSMVHTERGDLAAAQGAPAAQPRARRPPRACRSTRTAGASPRPASARPRGTWPARSRCSTRPSGSTTSTSRPTCSPSPRCGPGSGSGRAGRTWRWPGRPTAGCRSSDEPDYLREFEHVTLARALLAGGDDSAAGFLERLLAAAEAGGRLGSVAGDPRPARPGAAAAR